MERGTLDSSVSRLFHAPWPCCAEPLVQNSLTEATWTVSPWADTMADLWNPFPTPSTSRMGLHSGNGPNAGYRVPCVWCKWTETETDTEKGHARLVLYHQSGYMVTTGTSWPLAWPISGPCTRLVLFSRASIFSQLFPRQRTVPATFLRGLLIFLWGRGPKQDRLR